jgi:hypothetical protein
MGDVSLITLDAKPIWIDASWGFEFLYPDGRQNHVNGFLSEEEALCWIGNGGCEDWARNSGLVCDKCCGKDRLQ